MSKVILNSVGNLDQATSAVSTINSNSAVIQTEFDNTLSRDGTAPNQMNAVLDMNSQHIINLPAAVANGQPVRFDEIVAIQDLAELTALVAEADASANAAATSQTAAAGSATSAAGSATTATNAAATFQGVGFRANKASVDQTGVPNGIYRLITFSTTSFDGNNYFVPSSSTYVPPAGLVLMSGQLWITSGALLTSNAAYVAKIIKNFTVDGSGNFVSGADVFTGIGSPNAAFPGTASIDFAGVDIAIAGDYYGVFLFANSISGCTVDGNPAHTFFAGAFMSSVLASGFTGTSPVNVSGGVISLGNVPVSKLNSGTSASSTTFWRGDATWAAPPAAAAGTLTGTTLAANVVTSSLTTVGTIGTGLWNGTIITGTYGGTGINNGTKTLTYNANLNCILGADTTFIAANGGSFTLPTATDTLVGLTATQTLTNKTLTSPTLTTPALGTPASGVLTNCTGLPVASLTGTTLPASIVNSSLTTVGTLASPVLTTPNIGTPSAGVLTNCTGLPAASVTGILGTTHGGSGVAAPPTFYTILIPNVNLNSVADTAFTVVLPAGYSNFRIQNITVWNKGTTASLTTAQVGIFTLAAGGGTAIMAATGLTSITATGNNTNAAIANPASTLASAALNTTSLFFRVTTAQGAAATADIIIPIVPIS